MATKTFNAKSIIELADAGKLTNTEIRKAIKRADELGLREVVGKLQTKLVQPESFANDNTPIDLRDRVAKGISALKTLGYHPNRTEQMLRRHGIIETLNRIAKNQNSSENFDRLRNANMLSLTAEAIILDYQEYFSEQAIALAQARIDSLNKT